MSNDNKDELVGRIYDGRYRVTELLGSGGCGAVYLAQQQPLERAVALKVLRPELAANATVVLRFQQEARAIAALSSPHTVRLIDFGVAEDGQLFMVMEYLRGESLRDLISRVGPLSPATTVRLLSQVADSLSEAHTRGIIHRDIKPENLFVSWLHQDQPHVRVLDFGVARVAGDAGLSLSLTATGTMLGSPAYMAPEQALADQAKIGPATDVYAMGVVAFELLTGRRPFEHGSIVELLTAHVQDAPTWPPMPTGEVPAELAALVMRCLAKPPTSRPRTAAELAEALRALDPKSLGNHSLVRPDEAHRESGEFAATEVDFNLQVTLPLGMHAEASLNKTDEGAHARTLGIGRGSTPNESIPTESKRLSAGHADTEQAPRRGRTILIVAGIAVIAAIAILVAAQI